MIVKVKTPLRLGLAGGGTDLDIYSNNYGGVVINTTINMYVHCVVETNEENKIEFKSEDLNIIENYNSIEELKNRLPLHFAVYKRIIKDYNNSKPIYLRISTYAESPIGSGLGTSSALAVSIIKCFNMLLNLKLNEREIVSLAHTMKEKI